MFPTPFIGGWEHGEHGDRQGRGTRWEHGGNTREHEGTRGNIAAGTRREHGGNAGTRETPFATARRRRPRRCSRSPRTAPIRHTRCLATLDPPPRYMWGVGLNLQGSTSAPPVPHVCDGEIALDGGSMRLVMRESDPHARRAAFSNASRRPLPPRVARPFSDCLRSPAFPHARGIRFLHVDTRARYRVQRLQSN